MPGLYNTIIPSRIDRIKFRPIARLVMSVIHSDELVGLGLPTTRSECKVVMIKFDIVKFLANVWSCAGIINFVQSRPY